MKPLKEYTDIELKAMVYDYHVTVEFAQGNIAAINQELAERLKKPKEVIK